MNCLRTMLLIAAISQTVIAHDAAGRRLSVNLVDGSRIIGVPQADSLQLVTDYANLTIPLVNIDKVDWQESNGVMVLFNNGDRLTGRMVGPALKLNTLFGKATIALEHLRAVEVIPAARAPMPPPTKQGLLLYFPFDKEADGDLVLNRARRAHHGKLLGAKWTSEGKRGGAYQFNGGNQRIEIADHPGLNLQKLTVCAWVFANDKAHGNYRGVLAKTSAGSWSGGFGLARYPSSPNINFFVHSYSGRTANHPLPNKEWTHLTGVYDGSTVALYTNGKLTQRVPAANQPVNYPKTPLMIGSAPTGYGWLGKIDEVMVFERALSDKEVRHIYQLTR